MPQLPTGRPILAGRPHQNQHQKVVTHRDQITPGQRGLDLHYVEAAQVIINDTGKTGAIALHRTAMPTSVIPPHSQAILMVSNIAANTATAGRVNFFAYQNEAEATAGGVTGMSASVVGNMSAAGHVYRQTFIAPLANDKLLWEMTVNGTVAFDYTLYLVAYLIG